MNKHNLQQRLNEIEQELQKVGARYNMLIGQKQECLHWLQQHAIKESAELKNDEDLKNALDAHEVVELNLPQDAPAQMSAQGGC